jgi:NitT/TauT family transport system substrate-binding protein
MTKKCKSKKRSDYNKERNAKRYVNVGGILLVLSLVVLGLGCISEEPEKQAAQAEKLDKIVVSSPFSPLAMPMAYIVENNMLQDVAEDVELVIWNNPDQLRAMMTQEQADFVSVPSNVASRISVWGVFYVISTNTSVQSLQDLKGEVIYVPFRGDQPDLVFRYICQQQGIDPFEDCQIQYVASPLDVTMSMLAGTAEHAVTLEPGAAVAIMKAEEKGMVVERVIDLQAEWGNVTGQKPRFPNAGVVALSNIQEHPEAVEAFCNAYDEAVEWTNQNPHEAAILAAKYVEGVNAPAFEESLDYTIFESFHEP